MLDFANPITDIFLYLGHARAHDKGIWDIKRHQNLVAGSSPPNQFKNTLKLPGICDLLNCLISPKDKVRSSVTMMSKKPMMGKVKVVEDDDESDDSVDSSMFGSMPE